MTTPDPLPVDDETFMATVREARENEEYRPCLG